MIWERLLPALTPFVLWLGAVVVAAQWGLFQKLDTLVHMGILFAGLAVAVTAGAWRLYRFRVPSFTETNQRLALDNGVRPEFLIGLRHVVEQPPLKVGKPKAGVASGDPLALRYLLVMLGVLGYLSQGPVPLTQIADGFVPFEKPALLAERAP